MSINCIIYFLNFLILELTIYEKLDILYCLPSKKPTRFIFRVENEVENVSIFFTIKSVLFRHKKI